MKNFKVKRNIKVGEYFIKDIFEGLEDSYIIKEVLKVKQDEINKIKVRVINCKGYMWTDDTDISIYICKEYLKKGKIEYIYLDILHEIIHVFQAKKGMNLFDTNYKYFERPTEIEAYMHTIEEAKRIGLSNKEILDYLKVEWVSEEEIVEFAKRLSIIA